MSEVGTCANCGSPLPADPAVGGRYCETCAAAWRQGREGDDSSARSGGEEFTDPASAARRCANCGEPLDPAQPAGHGYCARCSAAWHRGGVGSASRRG